MTNPNFPETRYPGDDHAAGMEERSESLFERGVREALGQFLGVGRPPRVRPNFDQRITAIGRSPATMSGFKSTLSISDRSIARRPSPSRMSASNSRSTAGSPRWGSVRRRAR